jgi:hypothetical protein
MRDLPECDSTSSRREFLGVVVAGVAAISLATDSVAADPRPGTTSFVPQDSYPYFDDGDRGDAQWAPPSIVRRPS